MNSQSELLNEFFFVMLAFLSFSVSTEIKTKHTHCWNFSQTFWITDFDSLLSKWEHFLFWSVLFCHIALLKIIFSVYIFCFVLLHVSCQLLTQDRVNFDQSKIQKHLGIIPAEYEVILKIQLIDFTYFFNWKWFCQTCVKYVSFWEVHHITCYTSVNCTSMQLLFLI